MTPKKNILIFIDWYKPGFKAGGPIQSCANLVEHLKDEFNFSIVTRNTDYGDNDPYPNISTNNWTNLSDGSRVYYLAKEKLNYSTLTSFISNEYDAVYLHSFFSFYFTVIPLFYLNNRAKVILAPRGMLGQGALQLKSIKKKVFIIASKLISLHKNIIWHASTTNEELEIKAVFNNAKTVTAIDLPPNKQLVFSNRVKTENSLKLFFLSRISPKKNLLKVFDYLEKINEKYKIEFDIIGPIDDAIYWNACKDKINSLVQNKNITINYKGSLPNALLNEQLKQYHFMILPTLNENFGHVILDALAASCPVIISDQTPWRDLQQKEIGWDIPLKEENKFIEALETAASINQEEFNTTSQKSFEAAQAFYQNKEAIEQNRKLFED